jgi:hypothetical protein
VAVQFTPIVGRMRFLGRTGQPHELRVAASKVKGRAERGRIAR